MGIDFIHSLFHKLNSATNIAELENSVERAFFNTKLGDNCRIFSPEKIQGNKLVGDLLTKDGWISGTMELEGQKDHKIALKYINGQKATHKARGTIIANIEKYGLSIFHEMGHEMTSQSKSGKLLQKMKAPTKLKFALLIPLAILLLPGSKNNKDKNKNGLSNTAEFIKDNGAILTLGAYSPLLLEEGLASLKGNKIAKEFCSKPIYKNVVKNNRYGFLSYVLGVTGITLCSYIASKLNRKD